MNCVALAQTMVHIETRRNPAAILLGVLHAPELPEAQRRHRSGPVRAG